MLATAGASKALRNPSNRHIRQWYLLADLYERAGDVPRARELFERILRVDREAYDVAERLMALGPVSKPRSSPRSRTEDPGQPQDRGRPEATSGPSDRRPDDLRSRRRSRPAPGDLRSVEVGRKRAGCASGSGRRAHHGDEGADRRQRPEHAGIGHRHFDAAVALGEPVLGADEAVQRVAAVEVAGPRDVGVVVGRCRRGSSPSFPRP